MPAPDAIAALDRVLARYRRDVNTLAPGAPADALTSLEGHLGVALPPGYRRFLLHTNGASLFRGTLRLRAASDVAPASAAHPSVILFADGPTPGQLGAPLTPATQTWAFAPDGIGGHVFGKWDGAHLNATHASFDGWFAGELAVTDGRQLRPEDADRMRFDADPEDPFQRVAQAARLRATQPAEAVNLLRAATRQAPHLVAAWIALGDALAPTDRGAARHAWLVALRAIRLPVPWPGAGLLDAEAVRSLALIFPNPDELEREMERFLTERVTDVLDDREAELVEAVGRVRARSLLARGRRRAARDAIADLLARLRGTRWGKVPWDVVIELAEVEVDLGAHDEAEMLLRRLRRDGPRVAAAGAPRASEDPARAQAGATPTDRQALGQLVLARIAVNRQEPWAEEILADALAGLTGEDRVRALVLAAERAVRVDRADVAAGHLDAARREANQVAHRPTLARIALGDAEVARARGDKERARALLKQALATLGDVGSPEVRFRVVSRLGDLAFEDGNAQEAANLWQRAARGFGEAELPVREAWALTRLAQVAAQPDALITAARQRFTEADHAAGIAALDATCARIARARGDAPSGWDPVATLGWHLDRATAQARARHDAQRARPPWDRPDADRPERRLGAHRLAIAASGERVVELLAWELDTASRAAQAGRGRATDPPVMRYVAAVDLLSGHPSFNASRLLLDHLLGRRVEGHAWRALVGAIARSPNAALVDGLLTCLENPRAHPAPSVAVAAELVGLRRERAAVPALVELARPEASPISRKAALTALGRIGDRSQAHHLVPALDEPALAETAAIALLLLGDRRGVDFHARALHADRRDLAGSPGEIVGRYGGPDHLLLLVRVSEGGDDRAHGALLGLGLLGDPRAVPPLLAALGSRSRKTLEIAAGALSILTGHHEDLDAPAVRARWTSWWETHQDKFAPGVRVREGQRFGPPLLFERMEHPESYVRRTAYDELVITCGHDLPYDVEGPWRVQRAHLESWRAWWHNAKHRISPGSWTLDGHRITT